MSKVNKVVACGRQIYKNNAKNNKPRKREKFNKDEQPVSMSHKIEGTAQKKGTKPVMSNKQDENPISFRHGEFNRTDASPNPHYDGRCHPFWEKVI